LAKYTRPTGRMNKAPASDRNGDTPFAIGQSRGQIKYPNQNGHPRPKNLIADATARRDYFGGSENAEEPLYKPFRSSAVDDGETPSGAGVYHMPHSRSFGGPGKDNGWTRVRMGDDNDADAITCGNKHGGKRVGKKGRLESRPDGFVMGQRVGRFCPECNLGLPVGRDECPECS
jgi:hypothetical protein